MPNAALARLLLPAWGRPRSWTRIRRAQVNSGSTPWDFSSIDLSGAGSTATRNSAAPTPYEGAGYLTFACDGSDGANGRARGMIEPASWNGRWKYLRSSFAVFLPTGWSTSIVSGGSAQCWKFDNYPTVNCQVFLLYYQTDNNWKLVCKDAGSDTDITGTFTLTENAWHRLDIVMRLASSATGWARVWRDGSLVASGYGVKTIYASDNGSGHMIPYVRFGLAAHGAGQVAATAVHVDDCSLDFAA